MPTPNFPISKLLFHTISWLETFNLTILLQLYNFCLNDLIMTFHKQVYWILLVRNSNWTQVQIRFQIIRNIQFQNRFSYNSSIYANNILIIAKEYQAFKNPSCSTIILVSNDVFLELWHWNENSNYICYWTI